MRKSVDKILQNIYDRDERERCKCEIAKQPEETDTDEQSWNADSVPFPNESYVVSSKDHRFFLNGYINHGSIQSLIQMMGDCKDKNPSIDYMHLYINSQGGDLHDDLRMIDYIEGIGTEGIVVNAIVYGIACSSGADIFLCCPKRFMSKRSYIMIHPGITHNLSGDKYDIQSHGEMLKHAEHTIIDSISDSTGIDEEIIQDLINKKIYLTANKALEIGLIHGIIGI